MEFRIQDCLGLRYVGRRSFFQIVVNSDVDNAQILEALTLRNPSEPPEKKRHVRISFIEQISKLHDSPVSISNNNNKELLIICMTVHNNESSFHQKIKLHILCYNKTEDENDDKNIYIYIHIYIKNVCHYNKWSLEINLFTKVFIKRSVLIFGRAQPFFLRLCT